YHKKYNSSIIADYIVSKTFALIKILTGKSNSSYEEKNYINNGGAGFIGSSLIKNFVKKLVKSKPNILGTNNKTSVFCVLLHVALLMR
mgnify:CR=1